MDDEEKYDPVEMGGVEDGLDGRGVDGGDERTACDWAPATLIDMEFELEGELLEAALLDVRDAWTCTVWAALEDAAGPGDGAW